MAITGSNFVLITGTTLQGSAVQTGSNLLAQGPKEALVQSTPTQALGGSGSLITSDAVCVDRVVFDPAYTTVPAIGTPQPIPSVYGNHIGAFAKNGCQLMALSGTTPETLSLMDLTANSPASYAGDTVFSNVNLIIFNNLGAGAVVVTTGASNPANLPKMNGTSAGFTVPANSIVVFHSKANVATSASLTNIVCTPAATTNLVITVCGS
jgi:hypothetical protein